MSYEPNRVVIPTGLDSIGLNLGLQRLQSESLGDYQRRLVLESNQRSGPTEREFINSLSRRVGLFDVNVFTIDLIRDADGEPLAADPFIEITSSHLRAYSDYASSVIDLELDLTDRDDSYFLTDVVTALSASTYYTVSSMDSQYDYVLSTKLRYSNTHRHVVSELLRTSTENKLANPLVRSIAPRAGNVFVTEVNALNLVQASGDYFVDYTNGVLYSYELQSSFVSYNYSEFPFRVFYQPVKVYPLVDPDKSYLLYDTLISDDTGLPVHTLLNSEGASVYNNVLAKHPLDWGM